jgi:hypothetical protein
VYDWMRKHGDQVIPIVVQSGISWADAISLEILTIANLRSSGVKLLNMTDGGEGIPNMSEESLEKLRKKSTGRLHTPEAKKKMSDAKKGKQPWNKGVPMSDQAKQKLSEKKKGVSCHTDESRRKISESSLGRTHTEEARRKIGDGHRGKNVSAETRKKLSESNKGNVPPNKGKPMSDEQKAKLSLATKGRVPWNKGKGKASNAN